jgi:hypothetical protein
VSGKSGLRNRKWEGLTDLELVSDLTSHCLAQDETKHQNTKCFCKYRTINNPLTWKLGKDWNLGQKWDEVGKERGLVRFGRNKEAMNDTGEEITEKMG